MTDSLKDQECLVAFAQIVERALRMNTEQDVLVDHIKHEELLLENPKTKVLGSLSIPPPMQAVIILHRGVYLEKETQQSMSSVLRQSEVLLDSKLDILMGVFNTWMHKAIASDKKIVQAINGKSILVCIGDNWELLFIEKKTLQEL